MTVTPTPKMPVPAPKFHAQSLTELLAIRAGEYLVSQQVLMTRDAARRCCRAHRCC